MNWRLRDTPTVGHLADAGYVARLVNQLRGYVVKISSKRVIIVVIYAERQVMCDHGLVDFTASFSRVLIYVALVLRLLSLGKVRRASCHFSILRREV